MNILRAGQAIAAAVAVFAAQYARGLLKMARVQQPTALCNAEKPYCLDGQTPVY